jgi:hypothetical protein
MTDIPQLPNISPLIADVGRLVEKVTETAGELIHRGIAESAANEIEGRFHESVDGMKNDSAPDATVRADAHAAPDTPYRDSITDPVRSDATDQRKK